MFALLAASFLSMFDRQTLPPMLGAIAGDLGTTVGGVGAALSVYSICYAASQLPWSWLSNRIGVVRVLRVALVAATAFTVLTAFAVDPVTLWVARALSGAAIGAIVPAGLVYVAERFPLDRRAHALVNLATATSLGMSVAVVIASVLGPLGAWRWVVLGTAVAEAVVAVLLLRVQAGPRPPAPAPMVRSLRRVLGDPWMVLILALVLVEGAALLGIMGFLPAALAHEGADPVLAGVVTGVYGLALIASAQLSKPLIGRVPPGVLMLLGGAALCLGFLLLVLWLDVATVLVASGLLGFAYAFAHTQIQNWMTDVAARDRAVGTAVFATVFFAGAALGAALGAWSAATGAYRWLFLAAAIGGAAFAIGAWIGRTRYRVRAG